MIYLYHFVNILTIKLINIIILTQITWLCPRQELNLDLELRRFSFYPLNYED